MVTSQFLLAPYSVFTTFHQPTFDMFITLNKMLNTFWCKVKLWWFHCNAIWADLCNFWIMKITIEKKTTLSSTLLSTSSLWTFLYTFFPHFVFIFIREIQFFVVCIGTYKSRNLDHHESIYVTWEAFNKYQKLRIKMSISSFPWNHEHWH